MEGDTKKEEATPSTLMDAEKQTALEERERQTMKLSRIATEIDAILQREDMTCGEWGEIVELMSNRIGKMVSITKIKSL